MKLQLTCKACQKPIEVKEKADARQFLIPIIGEYFQKTCQACNATKEYHVNDVKAIDSLQTNLIGSLVGLSIIGFVTMFMWQKGVITNVGLLIGGGILVASNISLATSRASSFNKYRIQSTIRK